MRSTSGVKLFARVDNLFSLHYQNPTGYLVPGFRIFGGICVASYGVQSANEVAGETIT